MPITPTYPGVYVERMSSGVRTITGVATSVTVFVDYFKRGKLNQAVQLFSMADFEREYGGLDDQSEASYAIQQFYLNGGSEAWVVRTALASGLPASAKIAIRSGTTGTAILTLQAASPGEWGNRLQARVDRVSSTSFDLTVSELAADNSLVRQEIFRNLTLASSANQISGVLKEGSRLVEVAATTDTASPLANGTYSGDLASFAALNVSATDRKVKVTIAGESADANLGKEAIANVLAARDRLQAAIRTANPSKRTFTEALVTLYQPTGEAPQLRIQAGPGQPSDIVTFDETTGTGADTSTVHALKLAAADGATANVQRYTNTATAIASSGQEAGQAGTPGSLPDAAALQAALQQLKNVSFNLLCIPLTAKLDETFANSVISAATAYCEQRRAMFLVDVPKSITTVSGVKDWLATNATLRSRNAVLYFPRVQIADPLNNFRLRSVGASGTMAGLYARTDTERGVWKAPAGTDAILKGVQKLDYVLNDAENGTLNPLAINALRSFAVYGNVTWGARTLRGADALTDEYKYVPVQRLALYLEESLYQGLQWVVFEPNDEPLWAQIRLNAGAFMNNLFRQGAFQGKTPREAYFVKCDKETTTQNDINLGIVNIIVGFAPLKPAEFVIIKLQQIAGQVVT